MNETTRFTEGMTKKGGVNAKPQRPRPAEAPKGQGSPVAQSQNGRSSKQNHK
ncbi:MAG: hypothetical protein QGG64_09230 [Candidatus Latescibacteria bacterium]|nr:hypothetical protein [Candidatus Latescibacterota bacterium]